MQLSSFCPSAMQSVGSSMEPKVAPVDGVNASAKRNEISFKRFEIICSRNCLTCRFGKCGEIVFTGHTGWSAWALKSP